MELTVFINGLGLGGTEKAACRWARGLKERGHDVSILTLRDGPRRVELESSGIEVRVVSPSAQVIAGELGALRPNVIHAHAPGHPHEGDILGEALALLPKIPVVQTNIFGQLTNPREDVWTDFRLFISWTSCVQAARRSFRPLDADFFRHGSVAVYPLDPDDGPADGDISDFRRKHGVEADEVLFGRLSRPEPNKWTHLPLDAFRRALKKNQQLKLLLREPPLEVRHCLQCAPDRDRYVILTATSDSAELRRTMASLDVVLHTSSIGESFGYGIAEPMNFGKPVIANSTPWQDQAQIEIVRHGECGFIASTIDGMSKAILQLASDAALREKMGVTGRRHIRTVAGTDESLDRLENALECAVSGKESPLIEADLMNARSAAAYLDEQQFGHTWRESLALWPLHFRVRFHQWRKARQMRGIEAKL